MLPDLAGSPAGQLCFGQFWFSWNNLFDFKSIIHWIWIFGFSTFCFPWIISLGLFKVTSVQFSSVAQLCPTLCGSVDCSTPGVPVHHQLPELVQTRGQWVGDAIQPSHPLLLLPSIFPSLKVFFNVLALCIMWWKYWSFSFSISPSNEYSGLIYFRNDQFDLIAVQESSSTPQFKSLNSSELSFLYNPALTSIHDYCLTLPNTKWIHFPHAPHFSYHWVGVSNSSMFFTLKILWLHLLIPSIFTQSLPLHQAEYWHWCTQNYFQTYYNLILLFFY